LNDGNLSRHPSFPILIGNLVLGLRRASIPTQVEPGSPIPLPSPEEYLSLDVQTPAGEAETFRLDWPEAWETTLEPGLYRFELESRNGSTTAYISGVNAGDPGESDLRPREWIGAAQSSAALPLAGQQVNPPELDLRPWLLGAAFLFLLLEAFLAWR
jgi:hypothetical protein